MSVSLQEIDRAGVVVLHRGRNVTKADVGVVRLQGRPCAVKDYRGRPAWVRRTVGRWSTAREERAYRALAKVDGVPALIGRPHPLVLVTVLVPGTSLAQWPRDRALPAGFFERLKQLVDEIHAKGVVQGDLHHRDVLVGEGGEAWLVDFSTGMVGGARGNPVRRWLWRLLARLDRRAVLKLQRRFEPGTLTAEETAELERAPLIYRIVRGIRRPRSGGPPA